MDIFKHPTKDIIRIVFENGEGGITELDCTDGLFNDRDVFDIPRDWHRLTPQQ